MTTTPPSSAAGWRKLAGAIDLRPGEAKLLGWAGLYIFCLMSAYYALRPLRDTMGVAGGVDNLPWLFTGTLLAMLAANPLYAALVRRLPSRRFIPLVYLFFIGNIAVFGVLFALAGAGWQVWIGRAFFIWLSVFNLFVVSVFWALMTDVFSPAQAKRLFGTLAAAATVGAIAGSGVTAFLARHLATAMLLVLAGALLVIAIACVWRVLALAPARAADPADPAAADGGLEAVVGGSIFAGITHTLRSPYLLNIGLYILLYTITSTFLYFEQAAIARDAFPDNASRTAFFATVDLIVNILTLGVQLFLTGRILRWLGVAVAAAFLPALTLVGFGVFAAFPTIAVLVAFQVLRRVGNFGLARPTRELLFTVLPREDKYKAKNVIDTVIYRLGDQAGSWSYALLGALGLSAAGVALVALPLSLAWLANGLWLGRRQESMAKRRQADGIE
ncbi:NTP/NDP exchange transporter [Pollutimonas bauzanensis]|uniref:ADP,ATP carrier protein n=1 Tax=Pollutimonas bauzanensis TaxID=658167 RepID=A0A1M5QMZ2_9BURK|nr:Npt1/Npt2 family nucleotide transporter [Pollutimonas bauzanensis]SHH15298.1 ATP:ADP antiporter, AAA family [Pollutimonas bauzanensis]